jgi:hypothetical protein
MTVQSFVTLKLLSLAFYLNYLPGCTPGPYSPLLFLPSYALLG